MLRALIINPRRLNLQLADAALDDPLPTATVSHNQGMVVFVPVALMATDIFIYFCL
jgi:hypothetical protein